MSQFHNFCDLSIFKLPNSDLNLLDMASNITKPATFGGLVFMVNRVSKKFLIEHTQLSCCATLSCLVSFSSQKSVSTLYAFLVTAKVKCCMQLANCTYPMIQYSATIGRDYWNADPGTAPRIQVDGKRIPNRTGNTYLAL